MNKERRTQLKITIDMINAAIKALENILDAEEDAFDNLTPGLQQTIRGEQMDENISTLDKSIIILEDVIDDLRDVR